MIICFDKWDIPGIPGRLRLRAIATIHTKFNQIRLGNLNGIYKINLSLYLTPINSPIYFFKNHIK